MVKPFDFNPIMREMNRGLNINTGLNSERIISVHQACIYVLCIHNERHYYQIAER